MANTIPAKSILKQRSTQPHPSPSDEQKAKAERDRRNLGVALFHANKIQAQKDVQATILSNIETLLEYPSDTLFTPAEASTFTSVIATFQPCDFDSLIEERNAEGKCGYPLCSNAPRSASVGKSAAWRLQGKGAEDYCSNDCLHKAMYVKTQLSEIPAWDRAPHQHPRIELPQSDRPENDADQARDRFHPIRTTLDDQELALERGEKVGGFRPHQVMADTIVEKTISAPASRATQSFQSPHDSIEGYIPSHTPGKGQTSSHSSLPKNQNPGSVDRARSLGNPVQDDEEESWNALYEHMGMR